MNSKSIIILAFIMFSISILILAFIVLPRFYFIYITGPAEIGEVVDKAIQSNNPNLCGKIKVDLLRNPYYLTGLSSPAEEWPTMCFQAVAEKLKNPEVCKLMSEVDDVKDSCVANVANFSGDFNMCDKIFDPIKKASCYSIYISNKTVDISVCDRISNVGANDLCRLASMGMDVSSNFCKSLLTADSQNICYDRLIWGAKTDAVCQEIPSQKWKDFCFKKFTLDSNGK